MIIQIGKYSYTTSDEEIQEGDWFVYENEVHQCTADMIIGKTNPNSALWFSRKIVATTDPSLQTLNNNSMKTYTEQEYNELKEQITELQESHRATINRIKNKRSLTVFPLNLTYGKYPCFYRDFPFIIPVYICRL